MVNGNLQCSVEDRCDTKEWRRAIIIPVHKIDSSRVCKNYRRISLLSVPRKVFDKILNDRMRRN